MRVAFISPRGELGNQQNCILNRIYKPLRNLVVFFDGEDLEFMPNLGLLTVAGHFPRAWELEYIDEDFVDPGTADPVDFDRPYDLVCLTGVSNQIERAYKIAGEFRRRGVPVLIGGMHASALPDEALAHCDAVAVGEGEDLVPRILSDLASGSLRGIYRSGGNFDLARASAPRFDLVRNIERFNKIPIQATRGCPHDCEYCSIIEVYGRRFRTKRVDAVLEEIGEIQRLKPRAFLSFSDENLPVDRRFIKTLLREMIPLKVKWEAYADITIADDPELLDLMREAGCAEALIGFESAIPESLAVEAPWKAARVAEYPDIVRRIQERGVAVMGLFILGLDGDGPDVFRRTRDFIVDSGMYEADFAVLTPIPGTRTYARLAREGRLLPHRDWNEYTWEKVNYVPRHLTARDLAQGILWIYSEFNTPQMLRRRRHHLKEILRNLEAERKGGLR